MKLSLSFLAAITAPAVLMVAWYLYGQFEMFEPDDPYIWVRTSKFMFMSTAISASYVLILGVPAFLLLRWLNAIRWWSTLGAGFVLGAVPVAIFTWPLRYAEFKSSASVDGVQTMIDGVPTLNGWFQYIYGASFMGACGAAGALAFWLVWRR